MGAIIDSTIGWDNTMNRVIAMGVDGELYTGNPEIVLRSRMTIYL